MTTRDLREKYLAFFESKAHLRHPSGSLIPYDVTGRLDESLLFNGAGMVQFKPYFRGVARPPQPRLTTVQKCVRTGDIESVGDLSHLTFFEMLGNFSFGDYFKAQAITFAWEFLISSEWLGLDPARLCCTIFEDDDEAEREWEPLWRGAGFDPEAKIFRLGEDTNYWPANSFTQGPPGPCGPNSEIFYWTAAEPAPVSPYTREDYLRDEAQGKWLEIWNLVFIQFEWEGRLKNAARPHEGYEKEGMPPLPFQSVDTGMGLERTATVLAGQSSVYETDAFLPILRRIESVGDAQGVTLRYGSSEAQDMAMRIIADHIRTAVFCIADGVLPGNTGRGYVLRRLIRRAVLKGQRTLGLTEPFFHEAYEGVLAALGDAYPELAERREVIVQTLRNEETLFRRTLEQGDVRLREALESLQGERLSGRIAFQLYDTYGFPLEVTRELCEEAGVEIDLDEYERAFEEAQRLSRASGDMENVYADLGAAAVSATAPDAPEVTAFEGYEHLRETARLTRIEPHFGSEGASRRARVALDRTPFYAESGGQVGDTGRLLADAFEMRVLGTRKESGLFWHEVEIVRADGQRIEGQPPESLQKVLDSGWFFRSVEAEVDAPRRARIRRHHTATHLLHAALRQVLGRHVTQAGSYVGPDRLRFDFTHGQAMTSDELVAVERIVNEQALENTPVVTHADLPIEEARARGAMALFGEKYGDRVRMVEIGEFSRELCGGTHVRTTGEVGLFKIVSESSAASGVRRIEAVAGEAAGAWVQEQTQLLREAAEKLKTAPRELLPAIDRHLEALRKAKADLQKALSGKGEALAAVEAIPVGTLEITCELFDGLEIKQVTSRLDQAVAQHPNRVALAAAVEGDKVQFACKVGSEAGARGAHAGNLVREVAKIAGGGGGGRPDFATAGGKDASKTAEALAAAPKLLEAMLDASNVR